MGKAKRNGRARIIPADFTDAKRRAMGFAPVDVTNRGQVIGRTYQRRCPAHYWTWLTDAERASLIRYADLAQRADVTVKGCLSPVQGGDGLVGAERRMMRRDEYQHAREAANASPCALTFTEKLLLTDMPRPFDVECVDYFGGPRDAAVLTGKAFAGIVARDLVKFFAG
jgi:hypothetical protein